jgi:hypothetical protein
MKGVFTVLAEPGFNDLAAALCGGQVVSRRRPDNSG